MKVELSKPPTFGVMNTPSAYREISSTRHEMVTSYLSLLSIPLIGKVEEARGESQSIENQFFSVVGRIQEF